MSKLMYKSIQPHLSVRSGVFYFVRRIPSDVRQHYRADRVSLSLRTKSMPIAGRSAASINQMLEDYWLGLKLQQVAIPATNLFRTPETSEAPDCLTLSEARDLYLRLKSAGMDRTFVRSIHRNVGYVIRVLGDRPLSAYSTIDAAKYLNTRCSAMTKASGLNFLEAFDEELTPSCNLQERRPQQRCRF